MACGLEASLTLATRDQREAVRRLRGAQGRGWIVKCRDEARSLTNAQAFDDGAIALFALSAQVIEHAAALADQLQKTATRVVIFHVRLKVLGQVGDPFREERDLDLGGAGISFVPGELADDVLFALRGETHCYSITPLDFVRVVLAKTGSSVNNSARSDKNSTGPPVARYAGEMIADLPALLPLICPRCGVLSDRGRELWTLSLEASFVQEPALGLAGSDVGASSAIDVVEGILRCDNEACGQRYPIVDGIPILVRDPAQLLCGQPQAIAATLQPQTLALFAAGASDDAPLFRVLEHLSIYLDAHWGDCAQPQAQAGPSGQAWGGHALFSALATAFAQTQPVRCTVELGCGVGRGLAQLRRTSGLSLGIDLHLPALRAARRLLRGDSLPFARRSLGRHFLPAQIQPPSLPSEYGAVALICADALDPPLPPGVADRVVALNLLDSVSQPSQLVSVIDGLCEHGGEVFLSSPYSWQSSVVAEGSRLGEPGGDAASALRRQLQTGQGLRAEYSLLSQRDLPWELRRDARCVHHYSVDALHLRKANPTGLV